jgi:hypothetical protein
MIKTCSRCTWAIVGFLAVGGCGGKAEQNGGDHTSSGGAGGTSAGGTATGGKAAGGTATGGKTAGPAEVGGTESGGTESGGHEVGGAEVGGAESGGAGGDATQLGGAAGTMDLGGAGGTPEPGCFPPLDGLVGSWPADGNADDASGGEPGTLHGGVTFASGQAQQAFSFDGHDDFVDLGNAPKLHVSIADFTVEAWVRFESHQGDMSILDKMAAGGVNADGWRLLKQADDRFWFCFGGGEQNGCTPDPASTVYSTTLVTSGAWFHVAAVKTSTSIALFVNGKLEDSRSPVPAFVDTGSTNLLLGGYAGDGAPAFLNGSIDEAMLFNRALSAREIAAHFECSRSPENETGLACAGVGLVHTVPDACMDDGGDSGFGDSLEVYCCGGTSRFCLSGEACPWRAGCTDDVANCSRAGLATDYLASASCSEWKGHRDYYCGQDGQIRFVP